MQKRGGSVIQITHMESVDDTAFDHVKCPQCRTRLCRKPKGTRVTVLHVAKAERRIRESSLLVTCKRCGNHYLVNSIVE